MATVGSKSEKCLTNYY